MADLTNVDTINRLADELVCTRALLDETRAEVEVACREAGEWEVETRRLRAAILTVLESDASMGHEDIETLLNALDGRPAPRPTCETCRFWDAPELECRRHPPLLVRVEEHDTPGRLPYATTWPETCAEDWCGEHRPRS